MSDHPIVDGSTYTCPTHGVLEVAIRVSLQGEPEEFRCYQCWKEMMQTNCMIATRTPPPP